MSKRIIVPLVTLGVAALLLFTINGCWNSWEGRAGGQKTDDAYVRADMTPLSTRISGTVRSVDVNDYQLVAQGGDAEAGDTANALAPGFGFDFIGCSLRDNLTLTDHGHAIGKSIGLLQVVGGEQDSLAPFDHAANLVPEHAARFHIETHRRLVEKQQIGIAADGEREQYALFLPSRQVPELAVAQLLQTDGGQHSRSEQGRQ